MKIRPLQDRIIVKRIEEEEKTILVKGLVDQDKAELMGERWRKESFSEMIYEEGN